MPSERLQLFASVGGQLSLAHDVQRAVGQLHPVRHQLISQIITGEKWEGREVRSLSLKD